MNSRYQDKTLNSSTLSAVCTTSTAMAVKLKKRVSKLLTEEVKHVDR